MNLDANAMTARSDFDTVATALRHLDNDAVRLGSLLAEMLARRDQWLRHALAAPSRAEAEAGFALLIGRELERAAAAVDARRQAALMPAARHAAANLPPESPLAPLLDIIRSPSFRSAVSALGGYDVAQMGDVLAEIG